MIQIENDDTPIAVAEKIVTGTKIENATMTDKAIYRLFSGGKELGETVKRDMFDIKEIKEIADYLMVYCNSHEDEENAE